MENDLKTIKKKVCLYAVANSDLNAAKNATEILLAYIAQNNITDDQCKTDPLYQSLICAIITSYSKPFLHNKPLGKLKINEIYKKKFNGNQRQLHDDLLKLRKKIIGHSDYEFRNVTIFPPKNPRESIRIGVKNKTFSPFAIKEIKELIDSLKQSLDDIYFEYVNILYISYGAPSEEFIITLE